MRILFDRYIVSKRRSRRYRRTILFYKGRMLCGFGLSLSLSFLWLSLSPAIRAGRFWFLSCSAQGFFQSCTLSRSDNKRTVENLKALKRSASSNSCFARFAKMLYSSVSPLVSRIAVAFFESLCHSCIRARQIFCISGAVMLIWRVVSCFIFPPLSRAALPPGFPFFVKVFRFRSCQATL